MIDESHVANVKAVDGESEIRTRAEYSLPEIPTVVLYDERASGTLFTVLAALKMHSHAKLMGTDTQSDGVCRRSIELPNQMGAIEAMPYAVCKPMSLPLPHRNVPAGVMMLSADIPTDKTGSELMAEAIKAVGKKNVGP